MALTTIDDRGLKTPIDLLDDEKIRFGTSDDLEIFHGGGHSKIYNANGNIYISNESGNTSNVVLQATWGEESVIAKHNAEVELYYDNSLKAETTSSGFAITGILSSNQTSGQAISIGDNAQINLGAGDDLKIYHDGSHSYLDDAGTGAALGTNSGPGSSTFTPVAANYVYNSTYLTIASGTADNNGTPGVSGRLNNPFSGDFTFSTTATAIAGAIFGCFDADELGTFATGTDDGALDSMTKSWWYDDGGDGSGGAGSVGAGKIMYGNATQATSAIANGSVVTISRTGSTIKITDDGSAIHTFSQTHSGPVFIMIGHRNITSKSMNFDSITMTGTQGFIPA